MVTLKLEHLFDFKPRLMPLVDEHRMEMAVLNPLAQKVPKPDWVTYQQLDTLGRLIILSSTDLNTGKLVGYLVGIIAKMQHDVNLISAHVDAIYIKPEYRGGRLALRLIKMYELEALHRGASISVAYAKVRLKNSFEPLLIHCGYENTELIFHKALK